MLQVHRAAEGAAVVGIVDVARAPRAFLRAPKAGEDLQAAQRTIAQRGVGIVPVALRLAAGRQRLLQPVDAPAQQAVAILDPDGHLPLVGFPVVDPQAADIVGGGALASRRARALPARARAAAPPARAAATRRAASRRPDAPPGRGARRAARRSSAATGAHVRRVGAEHPVPQRRADAVAQPLGAVVMLQVIDLEEVQQRRRIAK